MKKADIDRFVWGTEPKRKPVPQSARTKALVRSKGKCEECGKSLTGLKPHIHHKDGDPKNNRLSNLKVLCPDCHSKRHDKPRRKPRNNLFGVGFSL